MFAGHRIESLAGRGGMGIVYRATHLALNRLVALKVIAPDLAADPGFRERFKHESQVAASIDHPHVIPIYHAGEEDDQLFITMRYVEGTDLRRLIGERGAIEPPRAAEIVRQVGEALDAAHARGLVHRDVKPANVLIAYRYGREDCYLTDFGLTKQAGEEGGLTKTGQWVGTIDYVAPEQIHGRPTDARADVYALGCVLFHALTGRIPFQRDSDVAKMFAHVNDAPPELPPGLPSELGDVVRRALAKLPGERYPSAGDLGRAAVAAAAGAELPGAERSVAIGSAAPAPTAAGAEMPATGEAATRMLPPSAPAPAPPPPAYPPAPPPGPPPGPGYYAPPPQRPNRAPLIILLVTVLLLGAGAGVLAATGAFSSKKDSTAAGGTVTTTTTSGGGGSGTTTGPATPKVTRSAVNAVLKSYQSGYSFEDRGVLAALFADGIVRTSNTTGTQRGVQAVTDEYQRQFDATDSPTYTLSNVNTKIANDQADVTARYQIDRGGQSAATGNISFHMITQGSDLLIDRIDAVADQP
ncbi:MAG: hypothetical protein QOJ07_3059 [Thermoleophilaceae bacterium]|nr:hypothetical protein [Thermoleophilaceae bacterium]